MPREVWGDVNLVLVGLGQEIHRRYRTKAPPPHLTLRHTTRSLSPQEIQTEKPKLLRKALACSDPEAARALLTQCGMDVDRVERGLS